MDSASDMSTEGGEQMSSSDRLDAQIAGRARRRPKKLSHSRRSFVQRMKRPVTRVLRECQVQGWKNPKLMVKIILLLIMIYGKFHMLLEIMTQFHNLTKVFVINYSIFGYFHSTRVR